MNEGSRLGRWSRRFTVAGACVIALAGCGGGSAPPTTTAALPHIPHALGVALAARADGVAAALEQGDACVAAGRADRLKAAVGNAVDAGAIPERLQAPALAAAARLDSSIVCRPPTTTAATTTAATTTVSTCDELEAHKQQLEDEKHALDQEKKTLKGPAKKARGKEIDARRHAIDQAEHALDKQAHSAGCH